MKVTYTVTLEVNEHDWEVEYGLDSDQVKDDIRGHMGNLVKDAVESIPHVKNELASVVKFR